MGLTAVLLIASLATAPAAEIEQVVVSATRLPGEVN